MFKDKLKRAIPLAMLGIGIASVAGASILVTTFQPIQRLGPYFTSTVGYDTGNGGMVGGQVHFYRAGTGTGETLFVGDVVYDSEASTNPQGNTVFKSATLASYSRIAGVVVGGTFTNMRAVTSAPGATDTAAFVGQTVAVLQCGRTWIKVDAAAGLAPGTLIIPSTTTAGKVKGTLSLPDTFYRTIGRLVDTGIVSTSVLANVCIK
jgi:hypothetical protein